MSVKYRQKHKRLEDNKREKRQTEGILMDSHSSAKNKYFVILFYQSRVGAVVSPCEEKITMLFFFFLVCVLPHRSKGQDVKGIPPLFLLAFQFEWWRVTQEAT